MTLPLVRLQTLYPGQMGVAGSDVARGIRWSPSAIVLYVDENHPAANAVNDGTDPENPLNSVQVAVDRLIAFQTASAASLAGSYIVIGAGATLVESVIVPANAPVGCTILGDTSGGFMPSWQPATATGIALTLRAHSWRVTGIKFTWSGNGTGVRLDRNDTIGYEACACQIDNCRFFGHYNGLYAIEFYGSPSNCRILNNEFAEIRSVGTAGTAYAILCTESSDSNPYLETVAGNTFWECENYIGSLNNDKSFNLSLFQNNVFHKGALIPAAIKLDLRGGSRGLNIVTGNVFFGDYSQPGGYWAHATAPDLWVGNWTDDIAEVGQVDVTTGITYAPPAA